MTLKEINLNHKFDENKNILIDGKIVSLFYFRAGYSEKDYPEEVIYYINLIKDYWSGRKVIELSTAIKCPNINTFLCTFKIFQYILQKPDILKK
jgi:glutathione synthase